MNTIDRPYSSYRRLRASEERRIACYRGRDRKVRLHEYADRSAVNNARTCHFKRVFPGRRTAGDQAVVRYRPGLGADRLSADATTASRDLRLGGHEGRGETPQNRRFSYRHSRFMKESTCYSLGRERWGGLVANFGGRYRLVGRLGAGGMGEVWLACDEELGDRRVAIKVMHSRMLADPDDVARFRREMRLASRMQHPNIMTVFTTGSDNGVPFMVMAGSSSLLRIRCTLAGLFAALAAANSAVTATLMNQAHGWVAKFLCIILIALTATLLKEMFPNISGFSVFADPPSQDTQPHIGAGYGS